MKPHFASIHKRCRTGVTEKSRYFLTLALFLSFAAGGCASSGGKKEVQLGGAQSSYNSDNQASSKSLAKAYINAAKGASVMGFECRESAKEQCNGIDDTCDGRVDEGCGFALGNLQITAAWNSDADIDLYVTDPAGEIINHQHRDSASGGSFDHEGRGACDATLEHPRLESISWHQKLPSAGPCRVELYYWGTCNTDGGPTTVTATVAAMGSVVGMINSTLVPNQRAFVGTVHLE